MVPDTVMCIVCGLLDVFIGHCDESCGQCVLVLSHLNGTYAVQFL